MARRPPGGLTPRDPAAGLPPYCRVVPGALELDLLVVPRAARSRVAGLQDGRLKVQLAAPPVDGEANTALVEFIAKLMGVRRSAVQLLAGATGRRKRLRIEGGDSRRLPV